MEFVPVAAIWNMQGQNEGSLIKDRSMLLGIRPDDTAGSKESWQGIPVPFRNDTKMSSRLFLTPLIMNE